MMELEPVEVVEKTYIDKIHSWKNDDNAQYYEELPIETFQKYAELAGLDTCCDLELIRPQIMQANSILEVAAGYGRVLNGLIQMGYQKRIVAVERCVKSYSLLSSIYANRFPSMEIFKADIRSFVSKEKFDLILWMWMGVAEFPLQEQFSVLSNLSNYLNEKGFLILDSLLDFSVPKQAYWFSKDCSVIKGENNSKIYLQASSSEKLNEYAKSLGLKIQHVPYHTKTTRPRMLHLIERI